MWSNKTFSHVEDKNHGTLLLFFCQSWEKAWQSSERLHEDIWFVFILSWCKGEISLWRISGIVLNVHLDHRCRLIDIEVWLEYHKSSE